jgi:CheY-like chemotaxis protein
MKSKIKNILLIDDDQATNFLHKMVIRKTGCAENVHVEMSGDAAIRYLTTKHHGEFPCPDLIFLDLHMPRLDGWGFIEEYQKLTHGQRGKAVIVMLTTSLDPDDQKKAKQLHDLIEFRNKPLTQNMLMDIIQKHLPHVL